MENFRNEARIGIVPYKRKESKNMKKILASLLMIGAVLAIAGAGTWAVFSDTEKSTGTFTSGVIDIAVDGQNPWVKGPYEVTSNEGCGTGQTETTRLKPCYVGYIKFPVKNVGDNPANIWLKLKNVKDSNFGPRSEPELEAEKGTPIDDISKHIAVDLNVGNVQLLEWNEKTTLNSLSNADDHKGKKIFLGQFQAGEQKDVSISFHLAKDAGNEYQGDRSTFDIELYAMQLSTPENPYPGQVDDDNE